MDDPIVLKRLPFCCSFLSFPIMSLYLIFYRAVWLVFLDSQCSSNYALPTTYRKRECQHWIYCWEFTRQGALLLAPWGCLGFEPISGEWSEWDLPRFQDVCLLFTIPLSMYRTCDIWEDGYIALFMYEGKTQGLLVAWKSMLLCSPFRSDLCNSKILLGLP